MNKVINTKLTALRRESINAVALILILFSGCQMLMPSEIRKIEADNKSRSELIESQSKAVFHLLPISEQRTLRYVEVADDPKRPLVVFVHGSPGDWRGWSEYLLDKDLKSSANMIAVDRLGFGGSDRGHFEPSLVVQAKAIAPLLEKVPSGQRVVVVGHSYGGPLAARLAMDYGDKVTDLVILAGSIDPSQERTAWYQYVAEWPPVSWLLPKEILVANREIMALKGELTDMSPLWSKITQRVSVIQGDQDNLVPPENADFAERVLTHTSALSMVRIEKMNHFLPWKQYALVKAEILKHLQ